MPRGRLALALVLAISAAACRGTGRDDLNAPGSAPLQLAGGRFACAEEYAAYEDRFYPPNHPGLPPNNVRPTRCFNSSDEAHRAGFALAPTPAGDKLVSGIYVEPAAAGLLARCAQAARRLRFPVPCPRGIPTRRTDVGLCGPCGGQTKFTISVEFVGPSNYAGTGPYGGEGHLVFAGGRKLAGIGCFGARVRHSLVSIEGHRSDWVVCPTGSELNSGHVMLRWRGRRSAFAVSIHGDTRANRSLAVALARDVRVIG